MHATQQPQMSAMASGGSKVVRWQGGEVVMGLGGEVARWGGKVA